MTTHERYLETAAVAIDFELSERERRSLADHLATCADCNAQAAALRYDASAIASLSRTRLHPARAERILDRALARQIPSPVSRLVLVAAVVALSILATLGVAIGAALIRQSERPSLVVVPPSAVPSVTPTTAPSGSPVPSVGPGLWTVSIPTDAATSLATDPIAVAEAGGRLVAVGGPGCTAGSDGSGGCWAQVRWSDDGLSWTKVVDDEALALGAVSAPSGPSRGMIDIAGGDDGFLAIGYAGDESYRVAVWTSPDGEAWERLDPGTDFARARIKSVTAGGPGWVVVGDVYEAGGPRAAIWSSVDGRTWTRVADGPAFDVGGYLDSVEEPGAGGPVDVAAKGDIVVAVGSWCDAQGKACRPALWRSGDAGVTWARATGPDVEGNLNLVVGGPDGFTGFGQLCKDGPPCMTMVAGSADGSSWTSAASVVLPGEAIVRAAASIDGGIVAAASATNTLVLMATSDGTTWEVIHYDPYAPAPDATIPPDYATVDGLGMTRTADGAAIVVSFVKIRDSTESTVMLVSAQAP